MICAFYKRKKLYAAKTFPVSTAKKGTAAKGQKVRFYHIKPARGLTKKENLA